MRKLSQAEWIAVVLGLVVVIIIFYLYAPLRFLGSALNNSRGSNTTDGSTLSGNVAVSGLEVRDIVTGEGKLAEPGKTLVVHYVGRLSNGEQFDSSIERGQPFSFTLGQGEVIRGWDEGLVGMREGGRRVLIISPELGYGSTERGTIPPNATLIFDVVLLEAQ